jgi:hypothetical protein
MVGCRGTGGWWLVERCRRVDVEAVTVGMQLASCCFFVFRLHCFWRLAAAIGQGRGHQMTVAPRARSALRALSLAVWPCF